MKKFKMILQLYFALCTLAVVNQIYASKAPGVRIKVSPFFMNALPDKEEKVTEDPEKAVS